MKNEKNIANYLNESKIEGFETDESQSTISACTISSLSDEECELIFQGSYKYRFEEDDRIR